MKITDKMRLDHIILEARESQSDRASSKTIWTYWLVSRRAIDAAIRAKRGGKSK